VSLFITCPVENVERATAFYTSLGWMLGSREMYANVGGVEELIRVRDRRR
jgi:predicted lactoylglutathione lyase